MASYGDLSRNVPVRKFFFLCIVYMYLRDEGLQTGIRWVNGTGLLDATNRWVCTIDKKAQGSGGWLAKAEPAGKPQGNYVGDPKVSVITQMGSLTAGWVPVGYYSHPP